MKTGSQRKIFRALGASVLLAGSTLVLTGVTAGPAQAGTCNTPRCGGEVVNNSNSSIRVANQWCWGTFGQTEAVGQTLKCVKNPGRSDTYEADFELPAHNETANYYYYYDTDSVRFFAGCVTKYHWWGGSQQTVNRSGKDSLWIKITDIDKIFIDSQSCP